jgi:hypothetical protein
MTAGDELGNAMRDGRRSDQLPGIRDAWIHLAPATTIDDALTADFEAWCLSNALRDAIEAINWFLEEAREVCGVYKLTQREEFPAEDYLAFQAMRNKFHEYGLPPKLQYLKTEFGVSAGDEITTSLVSANDTRNCLVHRRGIVAERDKNTDDGLMVRWLTLALQAGVDGSLRSVGPGSEISKDEALQVVSQARSKIFTVGDRIRFDPQEFSEVCLTLRLFVTRMTRSIEEYGGIAPTVVPQTA